MNYKETAAAILEKVGGEANVSSVGHCATRLRFVLLDSSKADIEAIKQLKGIIGVVDKGGQFQVVIGGEVTDVYRELTRLSDFGGSAPADQPADAEASKAKKPWVSRVLETIAGIFFPTIASLTGCGMLKALLALLVFLKALDPGSQTYQLLNLMGDAGFYFLPVILAVSAAKKFRCNEYLAAVIGGILIHPNFISLVNLAKESSSGLHFLGLPVSLVNYSSSVIPIILTVWFMSYVERGVEKVTPKSLRLILAPLITLLIAGPAGIIVIGPLGSICGQYLADFFSLLNHTVPWLVPTLVGAFTPLMIMCGMHYGLIPLGVSMLSSTGYDTVAGPGMLVSNIAQGAASLAVAFRAKDKELKSLATSVGITAVCGITEPAMYGISLRYKRPLAAAMAGGGGGGLFLGIFGVGRYAQAAPGLLALPSYIGGDSLRVFYLACAGSAIAFAVSFLVSFLLGVDEGGGAKGGAATPSQTAVPSKDTGHPQAPASAITPDVASVLLASPITGQVIPLAEVKDQAFAQGMLGQGCAIIPQEGEVYAPADGQIVSLFPTGHAIGMMTDTGCEVLIHIGLDTVKLEGRHFTTFAEQGRHVKKGDLLIRFDMAAIVQKGYDVTTPVLISNYSCHQEIHTLADGTAAHGAPLLQANRKEDVK